MTTRPHRDPDLHRLPEKAPLYVVWIDSTAGRPIGPWWDINSDPKPLLAAIAEARAARAAGYPAGILPQGMAPPEPDPDAGGDDIVF